MDVLTFKKKQLITAMAVATGTLILAGCVDGDSSNATTTSDSNSTSSSITEDASRFEVIQQETQSSDVFGVVQDTNGNAIEGATVSIGGITTTTDSAGAYHLADVPVTGLPPLTSDNNGNQTLPVGTAGTALQISIKTPDNYLDATVTVTPVAGSNLVATSNFNGSNGGNDTLAAADGLMVVVLNEGLAVGAGITVVPAQDATVTGVLRDVDTGKLIANTVVALEFLGVSTINQQQTQDTTGNTGYSSLPYMATTDSEGKFTITNAPEDAAFSIVVEGWNATAGNLTFTGNGDLGAATTLTGGDFTTTPEVAIQHLGDVNVTAMFSADNISPFVTRIDGVVSNAGRAILNDDLDGTQGIVIHLNEAITTVVDENSVFVVNAASTMTSGASEIIAIETPVLSADGMMLTVTTLAALPAGTEFDIFLQVTDFEDTAENSLGLDPGGNYLGKALPLYDYNPNFNTSSFVGLKLEIHQDPIVSSAAVTNLAQIASDPRGENQYPLLMAVNTNFIDNVNDSAVNEISQLNNTDNGGATTGARLQALAAQILGSASIPASIEATPANVIVNRARVHFDVAEAMTYNLSIMNEDGMSQTVTASFADGTDIGLTLGASGVTNVSQLTVDSAMFKGQTVELLFDNLSTNDVLTVTSLSTLNTIMAETTLTLVDQVAPTTIVQRSYGLGDKANGLDQVNHDYGQGGELSQIAATTFGTPYLNVTPYLLTPQAGATSLALPRSETWDGLTADFEADITNSTSGELEMDLSNLPANSVAYNAATIASWTPGARNIGVAFSEDVTVTGTPDTAGFTAALSNFTAQNDVLIDDQNVATDADLVNIQVDNVITLANADDGQILDFSNNIQDETANVSAATDNARVIIRDMMPPIALSAVYNGDNITITYNEAVSLEDTDTFSLVGVGGAAANTDELKDDIIDDNLDANQNVTTVTLDLLDLNYAGSTLITREVRSFDKLDLFNRGTYDHDNDANTPPVMVSKPANENVVSILSAPAVRDAANGTSWSNWGGTDVDMPAIAITDATGAHTLAAAISPATLTAGDLEFVMTYSFNHRIDLNDLCGGGVAPGALVLTPAEVSNCFQLNGVSGNTVIDDRDVPDVVTASGATLSTDGKVLTVTVNVVAAVPVVVAPATNTFGPVNNLASAWDSSAQAIPASDVDPDVTDLEIPVTP
ncbi:MAG: hypothetical protein HRU20_05610 [Pseudomonadales bacterium]|nr:hypothetical protein [Pseudomonadales bacterium]